MPDESTSNTKDKNQVLTVIPLHNTVDESPCVIPLNAFTTFQKVYCFLTTSV